MLLRFIILTFIGIRRDVATLVERGNQTPGLPTLNKFLVPYEKNQQFTGRTELLTTLYEMLCQVTPKEYNHRVALYGLGGIGKTQTALAYIYEHRTTYDAIYWISAANQAALFSSFQEIAKATLGAVQGSQTEVAKNVLSWFQSQDNWLVIIDNLDDIRVIDGYLPDMAPRKHTIITTRNPNSDGIPAKGLEVTLLHPKEAAELFLIRSRISVIGPREKEEAAIIVDKLGYLPLAIEQAAAYIREVSQNVFSFLNDYEKNMKDLHKWTPQGNWKYSYSVATTWSMSFRAIREESEGAATLLQLFAFLNPDQILIDFLERGANGLNDALRSIISNPIELSKALLILEKFSLIKWTRQGGSISIHRLVQLSIKHELSSSESEDCLARVIAICNSAFPTTAEVDDLSEENRRVCRRFQGQVIEPLLEYNGIWTKAAANTMHRVGFFLVDDGKYKEGERLITMSASIYRDLYGNDDSTTLCSVAIWQPHIGIRADGMKPSY